MTISEFIQRHSNLKEDAIKNTLRLFDEGATIPFIARYRKEMTGGLDEVDIAIIRDFAAKYNEIAARHKTVLNAIEEQGKLTTELKEKITSCFDLIELEDLYLPYKQKRLTKGEKAKKMGLEPLARLIMSQKGGDPYIMAEKFVKGEVIDEETAVNGAKDIIAEWVSENPTVRARIREMFMEHARLESKLVKGKESEADVYKNYFDHSERLSNCPSHRLLALYRANREGLLTLKARPDEDFVFRFLERFYVKGNDDCAEVVSDAVKEGYRRLIRPSIENEVIGVAKAKADIEAIGVFSKNLRQLLLAPPLGSKRILAIDPGFRTGCKVVCLDEFGTLLTNTTIFPHPPQKEEAKSQAKLAQLVEAYKIDAIAIGDGTAGRETETLVKRTRFTKDVEVFVVREDGASIYSASSIARKEFPDYDVTVRGSVSIGRRLMDPLAELVKIDPKSVGVGQYQHEVNQHQLKEALDDVIVSCVNTVGVDVNTASPYLLSYVSGLGTSLAENIVKYRNENGSFGSREELKKVPRLGDKAYEQAAGFIRIRNGNNPLDNSSVHPESYKSVEKIAKHLNVTISELMGNEQLLKSVQKEQFENIDGFTFNDIISELIKPGHDPRQQAKVLEFDYRLKTIEDLKPGMTVKGIVTNVTNFGAFVNIGIKENGLIHKSNLSDSYVEDPSDYISLHDHVEVLVMEVDVQRKRVGLKRLI